jgi:hypothetical protein
MANLVVSDQPLALAIDQGSTLHTGDHPINRVIHFGHGDSLLAAAGGENGGFI